MMTELPSCDSEESISSVEIDDVLPMKVGDEHATLAHNEELLAQAEERIRQLESEVELISYQYNETKRCQRLIDCESYCDSDGLGIQVIFMNTDIGRRHRHKVEEFLASIMQAEKEAKKEPLPKVSIRPNSCYLIRLGSSEEQSFDEAAKKSCAAIGCAQFHKDFMVDRLGWPLVSYDVPPCHTPGWPSVVYPQTYSSYLPVEVDSAAEPKEAGNGCNSSKVTCFNCDGDHTMSECTYPRDETKIRKNRQEMQKSKMTYRRYHVDEAKYGRMVPGVVSESLREALGLPANGSRLPAHIYRMRLLGYPPGWLIDAEQHCSGLAMFDKHGREVDLDGDHMEDGECPEDRLQPAKPVLDPSKLIEYPGYNAKPPAAVIIDECKTHGVPPLAWLRTQQELFSQLSAMDDCSGSLKRRGDTIEQRTKRARASTSCDNNAHDMDIADESEGANDKEVPNGSGSEGDRVSANASPQLDECSTEALERRKQELLLELGSDPASNVTEKDAEQRMPVMDSSANEAETIRLPLDAASANTGETTAVSHGQVQRSQSIGMQHGTPVPVISEFTRLPSYENFRSGIEDHIPYENLPDATGTYQRMSAVLHKVRELVPKNSQRRKN